jgi:hypothetical protein
MVEKARTMARRLEIPQWKADGLPSPTSPLDRASASPRGWRHRDAVGGGVGLGILAALEAEGPPQPAPRVSIPRRAARLEVSELGCSGRCATSLCGGVGPAPARPGGGAAFRVAEFLSCCDMCRRALDGRDIFMYRGEKAFCSMECRYHAMVSDEFKEDKERKRRAAVSRTSAAEMAGSACSGGGGGGGGQIFFTTGIVAA